MLFRQKHFALAQIKKMVHNFDSLPDQLYKHLAGFGGIAQLGERLHGMQEVSGSIPLTSTKTTGKTAGLSAPLVLTCTTR